MQGRFIASFLFHQFPLLLFSQFCKNLIPHNFDFSNRSLWNLSFLNNSPVNMINLLNLFLILSFIMANLYLQLSFIIFLLDFFNLIHEHFSALTCGWCLISFVGYLTLRRTLLFMGAASGPCAIPFYVTFLRYNLSRCETICLLGWWEFWLKSKNHLEWSIMWFLQCTSILKDVSYQICGFL